MVVVQRASIKDRISLALLSCARPACVALCHAHVTIPLFTLVPHSQTVANVRVELDGSLIHSPFVRARPQLSLHRPLLAHSYQKHSFRGLLF